MTTPLLRLLVLKTSQLARTRAFYQTLGIKLTEEKHEDGPVHYAGKVGDAVLEVYPLPTGRMPNATTRLGFSVASFAEVLELLRVTGAVVGEPEESPWGLRAVVRDPDGRAVELYDVGS